MKRLHFHLAHMFAHSFLVSTVVVALVISIFLISSCEYFAYKRNFPDEYYENNFIATIGFDTMVPVGGPLPAVDPIAEEIIPITGQWDFAWRYATDWPDGNPFPYMTLTPVSDSGYETAGSAGFTTPLPEGISATSPVYRLELANLVTDGDFEGDNPLGNWETNLVPTKFKTLSGSGSINEYSLQIDMQSSGEYATWSFLLTDGIYDSAIGYELYFTWNSTDIITSASEAITINESPVGLSSKKEKVSFSAADPNEMKFINKGLLNMILDDLRIKRNLATPHLRLLLEPDRTDPPLMNILYRFSVWVHEDPKVGEIPAPYHLDTMTITFKQLQTDQINSMTVQAGRYSYLKDSGWRKIEAWVSSEGNPQFPEDAITAVLELIIDLGQSSPGRVLIAQPELRSYPDGY